MRGGTAILLVVLLAAVAMGWWRMTSFPPAIENGSVEPASEAIAGASASASAATTESPPATPTPAPAKTGSVRPITFDDVKLALEKGQPYDPSLLTDKVKQLDGQLVRVRGYIFPPFQQTGLKRFVLVRDNQECCFGPGALLHDCIVVDMEPPRTADYTVRPVSVEGKFALRELKGPDGEYQAIYHLDGKAVK